MRCCGSCWAIPVAAEQGVESSLSRNLWGPFMAAVQPHWAAHPRPHRIANAPVWVSLCDGVCPSGHVHRNLARLSPLRPEPATPQFRALPMLYYEMRRAQLIVIICSCEREIRNPKRKGKKVKKDDFSFAFVNIDGTGYPTDILQRGTKSYCPSRFVVLCFYIIHLQPIVVQLFRPYNAQLGGNSSLVIQYQGEIGERIH